MKWTDQKAAEFAVFFYEHPNKDFMRAVLNDFKNNIMKTKKQDPRLVAERQRYELYYISGKYHIPLEDVKRAVKAVGRSRKKVYSWLREHGYKIKT